MRSSLFPGAQLAGHIRQSADAALRRPALLYAHYRRQLSAFTRADATQQDAIMQARLARSLARAARLPAYAAQPMTGIADWPLLAKADIAGREARFINPGNWLSHAAATGGTTGQPLILRRSLSAIAFEQASIDHMCAGVGLDLPTARVAVLRADLVKPLAERHPPYWRRVTPRRMLFSIFHLTPDTIRAYVDALRVYKPDVLMCYPSALGHLLALMNGAGERLHIPYVLASSETLSAAAVSAACDQLGATVIDFYGQAERVAASYGINGAPHRLLPLYGYVERGGQLGNGRELIGTSLWNSAQSFVRYRTEDIVRLVDSAGQASEISSLSLQAQFSIEGRGTERIDLNDGRIIVGINHLPRGVPGIVSLQVRPTGLRAIELLVVPGYGYGPASDAVILANCAQKFPDDVALRIVRIDAPVRLPSGKAPLLLRDDC